MPFLAGNPFLRLIIPLTAGILLQDYFHPEWHWLLGVGTVLFLLLASYNLFSVKHRFFLSGYQGIIISMLFIIVGSMLYKQKLESVPELPGGKQTITGQILDIPEEKSKTWQLRIRIDHLYHKDRLWQPKNFKMLGYLEKTSDTLPIQAGDHIAFSAYPQPITNRGNPAEFDYKKHMAIHHMHYQVYIDNGSWIKMACKPAFSLSVWSNRTRAYLLKHLKSKHLNKKTYAIASALILGHKDLLTPDIKAQFTSSGVMHILAVSGLHVGIIYFMLHYILFFLEKLPYGKNIKTILIICMLLGYAFLTGLSPSVCRATLMFSVLATGSSIRRYTSIYNSLAFSAFILLVVNPLLLFSISFQLSYVAVFSIAFFQPRFYHLVKLPPVPDKLWQWFTVALAAQIGTAPLVIHNFNQFPVFFWLTNFIAIPAATLILLSGFLYLLITPIIPFIGDIIARILAMTVLFLNESTAFIQRLPMAIADDLWLSEIQVLCIYLFIMFLSGWLVLKKSLYLKLMLVSIMAVLIYDIQIIYQRHQQREFIVYNINKASVSNYIDGQKNLLFIHYPGEIKDIVSRYTAPYWMTKRIDQRKVYRLPAVMKKREKPDFIYRNFMDLNGIRVGYLFDEALLKNLDPNNKLSLDYLVLGNDVDLSSDELRNRFNVQMVILDSSNSYYHRQMLMLDMKKAGICYYSVPEEGAFRVVFD
jgi:competence protein ComEC